MDYLFIFSIFVIIFMIIFISKLTWKKIFLGSLILFFSLCGIYYEIYNKKNITPIWMTKISNKNDMYDYARKHKLNPMNKVKYHIKGIKFLDEYDIALYGRITIENTKELTIFFPDAYKEKYLNKRVKDNSISFFFDIILRENFEYSKYPFDKNIIWIRLKCFKNKLDSIHVPDFKSQLSENLIFNDWIVEETFFSYSDTGDCHELLFNISIKRKFLSPIIENIIPFFILNLIFFLFFTVYKNKERYNLKYTVESASGLLFTILMSQINLRSTINIPTILYLDYFYILNYLVLIILIFFPLLDNKFNFNSNILDIMQKFYWPLILESVILITYISFRYL